VLVRRSRVDEHHSMTRRMPQAWCSDNGSQMATVQNILWASQITVPRFGKIELAISYQESCACVTGKVAPIRTSANQHPARSDLYGRNQNNSHADARTGPPHDRPHGTFQISRVLADGRDQTNNQPGARCEDASPGPVMLDSPEFFGRLCCWEISFEIRVIKLVVRYAEPG